MRIGSHTARWAACCVARLAVLLRAQSFLPRLQQENAVLKKKMESEPAANFDIEVMTPGQDNAIEMASTTYTPPPPPPRLPIAPGSVPADPTEARQLSRIGVCTR